MARAFQSCGASQIKVMKLLATRATFAFFFFSSRRRHTSWPRDWSSDVCSSDLHREPGRGGARTLVSRYGWGGGLRYGHVCESVTVTSLFTTLKYYPSNADLFRDLLLRYARTVPCPSGGVLVFEYVSLRKAERRFESFTAAEYIVDPRA